MKKELRIWRIALAVALALALGGCASGTARHRADARDDSADRVTAGKAQREIRVGMSGTDVVQVLGKPNMVATDENHREGWIYNEVAAESAYSTSSGGMSALILGDGGTVSDASSAGRRTLTIVIKFDDAGRVRDFAYHTTRF